MKVKRNMNQTRISILKYKYYLNIAKILKSFNAAQSKSHLQLVCELESSFLMKKLYRAEISLVNLLPVF